MKKRIKNFLALAIIFFSINSVALATVLPQDLTNIIKESFSEISIRFDGLIELADGTQYLPVIPAEAKEVDELKVTFTLPENKTLKAKPDLLVFNNNYALMKVIRISGSRPTVISSNKTPLVVKLGLLPQDLLVPENLVIPSDLRIILGDLAIPVQNIQTNNKNRKLVYKKTKNTRNNQPFKNVSFIKGRNINKFKDLNNRNLYISNFDSGKIHVVPSEVGRPIQAVNVGSVVSDLKITSDRNYLLATGFSTDKLYVVNTFNNEISKEIQVGKMPISIVIVDYLRKAFIANRLSSTISIIDLVDMRKVREVNISGQPKFMNLSFDRKSLVYVDSISNSVYSISLKLDDDYKETYLASDKNISSAYKYFDKLYVLSRTDNTLTAFQLGGVESQKTVTVGNKPIDIKVFKDKVYVLSAGEDKIDILKKENLELVKSVQLETKAFPRKFKMLDSGEFALVLTSNSNEMVVIDLKNDELLCKVPVSQKVNNIVVFEKQGF